MREISKDMKINLLVISIAFLGFAFMYLAITELYLDWIDWPYDDPYYFRAFGMVLLVLGVFGLISIYRNDWNQAKVYLEILMTWSVLIVIANFVELTILPLTVGAVATTWADTIILLVLIGTTFYFYFKEKKL
jgi:hypothetical protein